MSNRTTLFQVIASVGLCFCGYEPVSAGWFGPSDYSECVLDNIGRKQLSDFQVYTIKQNCKASFPDPKPEPVAEDNNVLLDARFMKYDAVILRANHHFAIQVKEKPDAYHINNVAIRVSNSACNPNGDDPATMLLLQGSKVDNTDLYEFNISADQVSCYEHYFYGTVN